MACYNFIKDKDKARAARCEQSHRGRVLLPKCSPLKKNFSPKILLNNYIFRVWFILVSSTDWQHLCMSTPQENIYIYIYTHTHTHMKFCMHAFLIIICFFFIEYLQCNCVSSNPFQIQVLHWICLYHQIHNIKITINLSRSEPFIIKNPFL